MIETFMLMGAVGTAFGWLVSRNYRARLSVRSQLRSLPMLDESSPDGTRVKVVGRTRALDPLHAPLSGRPCIAYRVVCGVPGTRAPHPQQGVVIVEERTALFVLDRGDEPSIVVDGSHANLDFPALPKRASSAERREQFLAMNGIPFMRIMGAGCKETIAEVDALVTVAGTVMRDVPLEPAMIETHFRDGAPPTIRLAGNAEYPLLISRKT